MNIIGDLLRCPIKLFSSVPHPPLSSDLMAKDPNRAFVHEIYIHIYRFVHSAAAAGDSCKWKGGVALCVKA
jgi:hypothetical protein